MSPELVATAFDTITELVESGASSDIIQEAVQRALGEWRAMKRPQRYAEAIPVLSCRIQSLIDDLEDCLPMVEALGNRVGPVSSDAGGVLTLTTRVSNSGVAARVERAISSLRGLSTMLEAEADRSIGSFETMLTNDPFLNFRP